MTPIAYSYTRWSTPEQGHGDSLRRQTEAAEHYASHHGLTLDRSLTFRDAGVSGFRGANVRAGALAAFIAAVERGVVKKGSLLLVENLDRLSREKPLDAMDHLRRILRLGVVVVTLQDGKRYTAQSLESGDDISDLLSSLLHMHRAHSESLVKSRRVGEAWSAKRRRAVEDRKPLTSVCPHWLKLDRTAGRYVVVKERAAVVQGIFKMAASGMGNQSIARSLNHDKTPSIGKTANWHGSYIQKLLTNEAVLGTYQPHRVFVVNGKRQRIPEGDPVSDYFPQIIPVAAFAKVRTMRAERRTPSGPKGLGTGNGLANLFTGLARCGRCGSAMHFVDKGRSPKGGRYLVCERARRGIGCEYRAWRYERFESVILTSLWKQIDWRKVTPRLREEATQAAEDLEEKKATADLEGQKVTAQLERMADALMDAPKSQTLLARLDKLEQRKAELAAEQRRLGDALEVEREKARTAKEATKDVLRAFAEWMNAPQEHGSRAKVAAALRETVRELRLHKEDGQEVVEAILRNGADPLRIPMTLFDKLGHVILARTLEKLKADRLKIGRGESRKARRQE